MLKKIKETILFTFPYRCDIARLLLLCVLWMWWTRWWAQGYPVILGCAAFLGLTGLTLWIAKIETDRMMQSLLKFLEEAETEAKKEKNE